MLARGALLLTHGFPMGDRCTIFSGLASPFWSHKAQMKAKFRKPWYRQRRSTSLLKLRSEEHTSELQSLMRISYAVFCLKKKKYNTTIHSEHTHSEYHTLNHTIYSKC